MIYLDNHATTPCDPAVIAAMLPFLGEIYGNPGSSHSLGQQAATAVAEARAQVAALIGASPGEIIFTSGATESNNLAMLGLARALQGRSSRRRIVTTAIEHPAVLEPCRYLAQQGFELCYLPLEATGQVQLEAATAVINEDTLLVSVQAANNEIGTVQALEPLAAYAHDAGAVFHSDAVQAVGKVPLDVNALAIDMLAISAHKLYGPKGVGALYLHGGARGIPLEPLAYGGGQEQGLRSGTLNVAAIVGFGQACALCAAQLPDEARRLAALRDRFEARLLQGLAGQQQVRRNGDLEQRLPHNSSLTFPGLDAEALLLQLPELALSTGSACHAGALEPSVVLQAVGLSRADAASSLRLGLGRFTSQDDVDTASSLLLQALQR